MIALTDREGGQLAKFAEAVAQRVDHVAAGDRQQIGAIGAVRLIGAVDRGSPVRRAADHRRRQYPAEIAIGDKVFGVADRRRHLALQPDGMTNPSGVCGIAQPDGLGAVTAERPFAIDVLAGLDCRHDRPVMIGHLDADRDQIDVGMLRQFLSENASRAPRCRAAASAESCRVVQTAVISNSGSALSAGI